MSALYIMRFVGQADSGAGVVYVGKGMVLGADVGGLKYQGAYKEVSDRMGGTVTLSAPYGGVALVTGALMPAGASIPLQFDWPKNFANGQELPITVQGHPVKVTFEKLGDIP